MCYGSGPCCTLYVPHTNAQLRLHWLYSQQGLGVTEQRGSGGDEMRKFVKCFFSTVCGSSYVLEKCYLTVLLFSLLICREAKVLCHERICV